MRVFAAIKKLLGFIGKINTVVILTVLYFTLFALPGIIMNGKKLFSGKEGKQKSYWRPKKVDRALRESLDQQF